MKSNLSVFFASACFAVLLTSRSFGAPYVVTDISSFAPGVDVRVAGINSSNLVVGTLWLSDGTPSAFAWSAATGLNNLPVLTGYGGTSATGVNDSGQIVGYSRSSGYLFRATLWEAGKPVADLGALPAGEFTPSSSANSINEAGLVVGGSTSHAGSNHAFLWSDSVGMEDIGQAGHDVIASAINDGGTVVGGYDGSQAFIWTRSTGMQDISLPNLPYGSGAADINNSGQVLCQYYSTVGVGPAIVWQDGHPVQYIGVLPGIGSYTSAFDINNLGVVAGYSAGRPFVWDGANGIQALPLLPGFSGGSAGAINDLGVIPGYSYDDTGRAHLFLWTPVPEPSSVAALALGLVPLGLAAVRRRRRS